MANRSSVATAGAEGPDLLGTVALPPSRLPSPSISAPTAPEQGARRSARLRPDLPALLLGALILWFGAVHVRLWFQHPDQPVGLGLVILEFVQGTLFFVRRRARPQRQSTGAWMAMVVGSWAFLLVRPLGEAYFHSSLLFGGSIVLGASNVWIGVQLLGTVIAIVSLSNLGRSFGLLPGNRGVRAGGAYRVVRHPAYAGYFVADIGYLLENLSLWNMVIFVVVLLAQLSRIAHEEAALSLDPAYRSYRQRVQYRLLPLVF